MKKCFYTTATLAMSTILFASAAYGQTLATSTYMTINVTGDPSQFDSVPVATSNTQDPNAKNDPVQLKICNDSSYLYMQLTFATAVNPNPVSTGLPSSTYLGIDSDHNPSTGDAIYGSTEIGSNAAFQNDYPFTQTSTAFNSGGSLTSVTATASGTSLYAASPFDTTTTTQMIAIPLDLTEVDGSAGGYNGLVFPVGAPFVLEFYTSPGDNTVENPDDAVVLGAITYTLATPANAPEPASLGLLALGGLMLVRRRRKA